MNARRKANLLPASVLLPFSVLFSVEIDDALKASSFAFAVKKLGQRSKTRAKGKDRGLRFQTAEKPA
jgi:hypothetical protein